MPIFNKSPLDYSSDCFVNNIVYNLVRYMGTYELHKEFNVPTIISPSVGSNRTGRLNKVRLSRNSVEYQRWLPVNITMEHIDLYNNSYQYVFWKPYKPARQVFITYKTIYEQAIVG
jgi:hypothetical protein